MTRGRYQPQWPPWLCERLGLAVLGAPFTADRARAFASLERIRATGAGMLLPGHGEPWRDGVADAVRHR